MPDVKRAGIVGGAIVAALGLAVPFIQGWEGLVLTPHHDIVGTPDGCFGDTSVERRNYTPDECSVLLVARLAHDYAPAVIKCVPALADRPKQLSASLSLSYNIGTAAFCRSTAAKRFNAGDWAGGCESFTMWRFAAARPIASVRIASGHRDRRFHSRCRNERGCRGGARGRRSRDRRLRERPALDCPAWPAHPR